MKSLIFHGERQMEIGEWGEPIPSDGQVLIEVAACGICGTDLHVYKGMPAPWPVPGVQGHEFSGRVIGWGDGVDGFAEGDRVVVQPLQHCGGCSACVRGCTNLCFNVRLIGGEERGGFALRVAVAASSVFAVPDGLSLRAASMVEPVTTAVHAFEQTRVEAQTVAVFGAGPLGLVSVQLARLAGAQSVVVTEVVDRRLALASDLGATETVNGVRKSAVEAVHDVTGGEGADGHRGGRSVVTRQQAVEAVRPGGTVVFIALGTEAVPIDFMTVVTKEIRLQGAQCHTKSGFLCSLDHLASASLRVDPILTPLPLDDGAEAFVRLATDPGEMVKVVLEPRCLPLRPHERHGRAWLVRRAWRSQLGRSSCRRVAVPHPCPLHAGWVTPLASHRP